MNDNFLIVDDALPFSSFRYIKDYFENQYDSWSFNADSAYNPGEVDSALDQYSFSGAPYIDDRLEGGPYQKHESADICIMALLSVVDKVSFPTPTRLLRIRAGLHTASPTKVINNPHADRPDPHYAVLFYLHDTDGETIFYNHKEPPGANKAFTLKDVEQYEQIKIECKANRMVFFDGKMLHSSTRQTSPARRIVLNYNYI